jgi:NADH dehydrogenase
MTGGLISGLTGLKTFATSGGRKPRVVIIGGGFAGLNAARALKKSPVEITLIDRRNHHLFQPLLYQVATASLSPSDIAVPIRELLKGQKNVKVLLDEATGVDLAARTVALKNRGSISYDYLVLAAGASHSYFGKDEWAEFAPGMKTIEDAIEIRNKVILAFERAEEAGTAEERKALKTFVIVGGGPTGVELAGGLMEIARTGLAGEFRSSDPGDARVILIEALPRILPMFPEPLSQSAKEQLESLGVEVMNNKMVTLIEEGVVHLGEETIKAGTIIWSAGVAANPIGRTLGVPVGRGGHVSIAEGLNLADNPEVFVVGDMSSLMQADGRPLPGIAPVAMQQGTWAGKNIARVVAGEAVLPFVYKNQGSMATIGKNKAIAQIGDRQFTGFSAWMMWNAVHVGKMSGVRNQISVAWRWLTTYVSGRRPAALIEADDIH